jgi:hypothetical protein
MNSGLLPTALATAFRRALLCLALALLPLLAPRASADVPETIRPVAAGLGSFNYWTTTAFANTLTSSSAWLEFGVGEWGTGVFFFDANHTPNPQFNSRGLPQYLNAGKKLRVLLWPYNVQPASQPADWPKRGMTGYGKWVVTWVGDADIRLQGATFVAAESSGAATGRLVNGRRVYQMGAANPSGHVTIEEINAAVGLSDLKVWLPDPANPTAQSLETSGRFWHPAFLRNLAGMEFGSIRFMDWGSTNASPQRDWSDRRLPDHVFQSGVLHRRAPATGFAGDRRTGVAYEHMVRLSNETGRDLWLCVPHLATDDYMLQLARLIRFGSDGVNPYTGPQADPVHPPLDPSLRLWLEYSNEIWSNGTSFPQGNWAEAQAIAAGLGGGNVGKARFNARRSSQLWSIFQTVFGGSERIVRVGALWTGSAEYTNHHMAELAAYGPTLTPAVEPDVISPTTYYGNGIQDWAYEQANLQRASAERSWFHIDSDFVHNTSTGATRPVSKPITDPYWTGPKLEQDLAATFGEWKRRIFSGSTIGGGGFDTTGVQGGFDATLATRVFNTFGRHLPLVSYEGGPSLYTDYLDGGDVRDDGITNFITILNRRPGFEEIYRIQLNMAQAKGLVTHGLFVDVAASGKYGQWGHLDYLDQPHEDAPKWMAVKRWGDEMLRLRNPLNPLGAVPSFTTPGTLPQGAHLQPYSTDIVATGGDVAPGSALEWQIVGSLLLPGLSVGPVPGDPTRYRIQGTPQLGGWSFVYLRVNDDDGDAAWKVFSLYSPGGPGVLVESAFAGPTNASSLPYTTAQALDSARISWSGIVRGAVNQSGGGSATGTDGRGVRIDADDGALRFSLSQGTTYEADSTLASALTDNEYLAFTVTPLAGQPLDLRGAEFQFTWERLEFHSPRAFAIFTSVGGFTEGAQLYTSPRISGTNTPSTVTIRLPATTAYADLAAPVQFRVYFYGSQYGSTARLHGVKLTRNLEDAPADPAPPAFAADPFSRPAATAESAYSGTLLGAATDPNGDTITWSKTAGPAWLLVAADGVLSGTPSAADLGANTFTVRATDPGGLHSEAALAIQVLAPPVATPAFHPAPGAYAGPVTLALSTATAGASIRYTTDGSTPTATTGTPYSAPFLVSATSTVRALAYKTGSADSPVASATYTISGGSGSGAFLQNGTGDIVINAENFGGQTLNGDSKSWSVASSVSGYQGSGYVTTSDTGAGSPGWGSGARLDYPVRFSSTGAGTYYIWARVRAPDATGNEAWIGMDGTRVGSNAANGRLNAGTTYNTWVWVLHGTTITATNDQERTLNLQRYEDGLLVDKLVLTRTSTLTGNADPVESARLQSAVATVAATPAPGLYTGSVQVSLVTGTSGASIRYTTDGSTPTATTGTLYSGPFTLSSSATVRALAYKSGSADSAVTSFAYTVQAQSALAFAQAAYAVDETAGQVVLRVNRLGGATGAVSVNYATADLTATAGEDYAARSGTLTWADGDSAEKTITIPILDDSLHHEDQEQFTVTLSSPVNATLASPSVATVSILDDDTNAPPLLVRVAPAAGPVSIPAGEPLTVSYTVQDDGAEPPSLQWGKFSGPGLATFADPADASTTVTFSEPGVVVIRLTVQDGLHTVQDDLTITVTPSFAGWIVAHPAFADLAPALLAPDSDPFGTGVPNLLVYALDLDPRSPHPTVVAGVSGEKLRISFLRARSELTYRVEASSDLVSWTVLAVNPGAVGQTVQVEDDPPPGAVRRFLRVRATAPL